MYPYVEIGQFRLGTYGICAALGFFAAWAVFKADLARHDLPAKFAGTMVVSTALAGIVGAKVYFIAETPGALFASFFTRISEPTGLSWLGGLIAGTATLCVLALAYKIPLLMLFDFAGPVGALVYAFGRMGCLLAGDGDYGRPTSLPWGMAFPRGIIPAFEAVHPTPIYEVLFSAALFSFLWRLGSKARPLGVVAGTYLALSGIARFLVEFIKLNPRIWLGLTNAQFVSLICIVAGVALLLRAFVKKSDRVSNRTSASTSA